MRWGLSKVRREVGLVCLLAGSSPGFFKPIPASMSIHKEAPLSSPVLSPGSSLWQLLSPRGGVPQWVGLAPGGHPAMFSSPGEHGSRPRPGEDKLFLSS